MSNATDLKPWEVVQFGWGVGIRHRKGKWTNIIFTDGQEIDLEAIGATVILHDNGIEFVVGG